MNENRKLQSRQTLKNYFSSGCLPEERHFHELIDSTLNMEDEGFYKTRDDGLQIVARGSQAFEPLLSFYRTGRDPAGLLWRIRFARGSDCLQFVHPKDEIVEARPDDDEGSTTAEVPPPPLLSLAPGGKLGVNLERPGVAVDVGGIVRAQGRSGVVPEDVPTEGVPADGKWWPITGPLRGGQALEIVAGVGRGENEGMYALLYATALNTYNPRGWLFNLLGLKNPIRAQHAYYRRRRDRLQLKWFPEEKGKEKDRVYRLKIRTRSDYTQPGKRPVKIRFHVTKLWHDEQLWQKEGERDTASTRDALPAGSGPDLIEQKSGG